VVPAALVLFAVLAPARVWAADAAPDFRVYDVKGKEWRFDQLKGRPLIVDFWATWCAPCRAELPHLRALHEKYAARGLTILGLSVDLLGHAQVRRYVERNGVRFPVAMATPAVLEAFGPIRGIPTTFFINRRGEIARITMGYRDREELEEILEQLW
jgi:cytochrome c biogenesis protein CcmG/thiol:disulfide interchange protein DsbE